MRKLDAILAKKGKNFDIEIEDTIKAELADRDFEGDVRREVKVLVKNENGLLKLTLECHSESNRDGRSSPSQVVFHNFIRELDSVENCGTFRESGERGRNKTYFANSLIDMIDAINSVVKNPELKIDEAALGIVK
jgi:esterase/lipase superfamily enzyme